uniref:Alsin n=1 Tax=Steinernema glaseri TaxID=37863 RepID=A0A1I7ZAZ0_9BILA
MQFVPIATDDRRLLTVGDVDSWRRSCCSVGASDVVSIDGQLFLVVDGRLNVVEGGRPMEFSFADSSLASQRFLRIRSGFGAHFLVTVDGALFAKGATNYGQCGVVQKEPKWNWHKLELVSPLTPCKHGTRPSSTSRIIVSDVVCGQRQVCVVDSKQQIWTFGNGNIQKDRNSSVICKALNLMPNRRVVQLAAGRGHFIALVEHTPKGATTEFLETDDDIFPSNRAVNSCNDCLEDERMRLSALMIEADKAEDMVKPRLKAFPISTSTPIAPKKSASSSSILLSSLVQGTSDSWSLSGLGKNRHSRDSCGDIEMTTISQSHELVGEPTEFSFVNLENAILSDSDESSFIESKSSTNDIPDAVKLSVATSGDAPMSEIWTWGSNECGQLGHGDFIARREPFPVNKLIGVQGVKVVAGDEHSAVLTGTGEVFVWGSNCRGQLKQTDQTHVAQPFLFKVGSQSSVLDVAAGGQSTAVIVSGIDSTPVVYFCGSHSKEEKEIDKEIPLTLRIAVFEKIGWPLAVSLLEEGHQLFLGFHPRNCPDETDVSMVFNTVFGDLKFARMIVQLTKIAQQLHERSQHYQKSEDACRLLNDLTVSLSAFSSVVARIANSSLYHLSRCGDVNLRNLLTARENDLFYTSIQKLHKAYVGCIAYGCFADIRIESVNAELLSSVEDFFDVLDQGPELEAAVERLCLEYEAESAKQHRRLGKLFQMAFMCVSQIKQMREQLASTESAPGSEISLSVTCVLQHAL